MSKRKTLSTLLPITQFIFVLQVQNTTVCSLSDLQTFAGDICIYICIIYHYVLRNAKIELNERPSLTPSNWHWTSINTQFTDHVTAFRRRCLLIIRCLSISWLHAYSVAESTGLSSRGYPWRWPRITSQMCTLGRLACNWKTGARGQWSRAWERSYYSYRRHATSNFVLTIPLNSWYGSIVS